MHDTDSSSRHVILDDAEGTGAETTYSCEGSRCKITTCARKGRKGTTSRCLTMGSRTWGASANTALVPVVDLSKYDEFVLWITSPDIPRLKDLGAPAELRIAVRGSNQYRQSVVMSLTRLGTRKGQWTEVVIPLHAADGPPVFLVSFEITVLTPEKIEVHFDDVRLVKNSENESDIGKLIPIAANDTQNTPEDAEISIDVLANDTDPAGTALEIKSAGSPSNGTTSIVDGEIVYTPNPNFNGFDSFTYTVENADGNESDAGTVTVTVAAVADVPETANDTAETPEDNPVTIDVLANDNNPDGDATIVIVRDSEDGVTAVDDGKLIFTPNDDFYGSTTVEYILQNTGGDKSDPATTTITVTPVDDLPRGQPAGVPVRAGDSAVIDVLASYTEVDGEELMFSLSENPLTTAEGGTAEILDGKIKYTPPPSIPATATTMESHFEGFDSFVYTIFAGPSGRTVTVTLDVIDP